MSRVNLTSNRALSSLVGGISESRRVLVVMLRSEDG